MSLDPKSALDTHRLRRTQDDVLCDLTTMLFTANAQVVTVVVCSIIMASSMAYKHPDQWRFVLAGLVAVTGLFRILVLAAFSRRRRRGAAMTAADAKRWAFLFGIGSFLLGLTITFLTLDAFLNGSTGERFMTSSLSIGYASGQAARVAVVPQIAISTGFVVMAGLAVSCFLVHDFYFDVLGSMYVFYQISLISTVRQSHKSYMQLITTSREIQYMAHHDVLTGLPNRATFNERTSGAMDLAKTSNVAVGVLFLDLDRFKMVNDTFGHKMGDLLLIEVSQRLRDCVRSQDIVARFGGDEFAILQGRCETPAVAERLAARVIHTLCEPYCIDGQILEIGASVGVALYPRDGLTADDLLKNADIALYSAKNGGRGRSCMFEHGMLVEMQDRQAIEVDLRFAIERGEMAIHYQPFIHGVSGEIEGFEALLRWSHPVRGAIPPDVFIPLADETGLIGKLGQWVLDTATRDAMTWDKPCRIAIKLSPGQFKQANFGHQVMQALVQSGLPVERLELDVTEGVLIKDTERAHALLTTLRNMGARISLDDFGTGYSSLSYLRRFPFANIKIDKSFVQAAPEDKDAIAIVRSVVALGHNLGLSVTAKGIETEAQLNITQELKCDFLQGYLFSSPVPNGDASDMLALKKFKPALAVVQGGRAA